MSLRSPELVLQQRLHFGTARNAPSERAARDQPLEAKPGGESILGLKFRALARGFELVRRCHMTDDVRLRSTAPVLYQPAAKTKCVTALM